MPGAGLRNSAPRFVSASNLVQNPRFFEAALQLAVSEGKRSKAFALIWLFATDDAGPLAAQLPSRRPVGWQGVLFEEVAVPAETAAVGELDHHLPQTASRLRFRVMSPVVARSTKCR